MSHFRPQLFLALIGLFSLVSVSYAQTETVVTEKKVIVSPEPKAVNCTTTHGHWENDIWVATQTICTYENRAEGAAWVESYWACTKYTNDSCTSWEYQPGHWVKTLP